MFRGVLLPYQHEAVDRMVERKRMLVAYDLGLGKTVIAICAVERLRELGEIQGRTLVVGLSSVKYQWKDEVHKFTDRSTVVIDGTPKQREVQWDTNADYVLCNWEQIVNDWDTVKQYEWDAIIMDEATAIKAFRTKRTKRTKILVKDIPVRFALTGTPIENGKPEELFSIMEAVDRRVLGRFNLFDESFIVRNRWGAVERYRNLPTLHRNLSEALVRKTQLDPDVAPYLPDTIHFDPIVVPIDRKAAKLYKIIADDLLAELEDTGRAFGTNFSLDAHYGVGYRTQQMDEAIGRVMSKVTALKMLCDSPQLILKSASKYSPYGTEGSEYLHDLIQEEDVYELVHSAKATKLPIISGLVSDHLLVDEHKVVVFCSYVDMAHTLQGTLGGVVHTGQMTSKEKHAAKVQFQTDPETRVFISTDSGGYGVDLPQANLLINYDLPWSYGLATQRNGRIRRASSKWPSIAIQDILTKDSIEMRQYQMLTQKDAVASAVIDGKGINAKGGVDLTVGALVDFLKSRRP
jgi:SNF2 family DNA or RNA helicase